ncbi:MAG: glycosyltransferase [Candidatus Omnitrophica bacterium]|nr:glycosyltransferase [Candidatus Omnitrophota bacterium]
MNVLFIAPRLPLPADTGGKIRTFNIIKQIAKRDNLDLVCFSFEQNDESYLKDFDALGIRARLVPVEEPGLGYKVKTVLSDQRPFSAVKYCTDQMRESIEELIKGAKYDMVYVDHIHMAHYQSCFKQVPCIVDEHNVEYRILERCANVEKNFLKAWVYQGQAEKMKRFEVTKVLEFSACSAVSEDDARLLRNLVQNQVPIHVIQNGVDTEFFRQRATGNGLGEDALVFTGSMDWLPNDDAMKFFVQDVLPLVWQKSEDTKLYVVGKGPSLELKQLAEKDKRVVVTGRVDDVRPYMDKAKVFITPLRIGGGTRLKILEAMSMQKAVVSTSIGAEGINCQDGKDILLADAPKEFADKVLMLLDDPQKRESLGVAGRQLVLEKYDWNIVGEKLDKICRNMVHTNAA